MAAVKADYYEVLGVARNADQEAIRRAFHALARDCHPDVSDSPEDHRRFRELAQAYDVLSKPESRRLYDQYGYRGRGNHGLEYEDDAEGEAPLRGENVHVRVTLEAREASRGASKLITYDAAVMCETCEGTGLLGEPDADCPECEGTGQVREVSNLASARILRIEPCPECAVETCDDCDGAGVVIDERLLRVRIPPRISDGDQLRVAGEGGAGEPGAAPGDLLLELEVQSRPLDSPLVRYLALAGLLVAVTVLVAYLLLA
jgi:molecular chaperone DnaJ